MTIMKVIVIICPTAKIIVITVTVVVINNNSNNNNTNNNNNIMLAVIQMIMMMISIKIITIPTSAPPTKKQGRERDGNQINAPHPPALRVRGPRNVRVNLSSSAPACMGGRVGAHGRTDRYR